MRVIILGDLHYANYSDPAVAESRDRFFKGFFSQVAAHKADLVFAIGDTTHRGTYAELNGQTAIAREYGLDLIRTTGNHDADTLDKAEMAPYFLGGRASVSRDELYTSFEFGGSRFLLLDTSRSKMSSLNWSGLVSDEQLGWLEAQIELYNQEQSGEVQRLFVLGHHPLFGTTDRSEEPWKNIDNSDAVRNIFGKLERTPGFYICGHNHSNSLAGPDDMGWRYIQLGAPLLCQSYGLLTVEDDQIRFETINIDFSDPQFREDFEKSRSNISDGFTRRDFETVYGSEADRFMVVYNQAQRYEPV